MISLIYTEFNAFKDIILTRLGAINIDNDDNDDSNNYDSIVPSKEQYFDSSFDVENA